jgi:hypothetical protein
LGLASAFGLLAVSAFLELWRVKPKVPSVRLRDDQIGLMPESMTFHPQHDQDLTTKQARIGCKQAKQE